MRDGISLYMTTMDMLVCL